MVSSGVAKGIPSHATPEDTMATKAKGTIQNIVDAISELMRQPLSDSTNEVPTAGAVKRSKKSAAGPKRRKTVKKKAKAKVKKGGAKKRTTSKKKPAARKKKR